MLWCIAGVFATLVALAIVWLTRRPGGAASAALSPRAAAAGEAALALESITDPRAAVIAAYVAMEQGLTTRGLGRRDAEAPREYLRRVLNAGEVRPRETEALTGLFEEARFSAHPISEQLRERARSALAAWREPSA